MPSMKNFNLAFGASDALAQALQNVEAGGKEKRKRKEKAPKDPNAPKRPPSAYLLFQNDVRKDMQEKLPGKTYREVLTEISKRWTAMTEEQKAVRTHAF